MRVLLSLLLIGCGSVWQGVDNDGDGFTLAQGDCFDNPDADLGGHPAAEIYPGAKDSWYDGVDSNCDGVDDYDQDGDGHRAADQVPADGSPVGDDCWDGPADPPPVAFTALSGFYQPLPEEVHPGVAEIWYDGVDGNCDALSDFDQDGDGHDTLYHRQADGSAGDDCFDAVDDAFDNPGGAQPANVNPDATETWYDGTDANCDDQNDYDQDGDGYKVDDDGDGPDTSHDCNDLDATIFENDNAEIWYNGIDENCDGESDYDQDGDGHDADAFGGDDCNDDPSAPATALDGSTVESTQIYRDARDTPYDNVDEDCHGDNDFDADGDGQTADDVPDASGHYGTDCNDRNGSIYAGAPETWYDGIDEDCSGGSDYDQDDDGFDAEGYSGGSADDCDDGNAAVHPDSTASPNNEDCATAADDDCTGSTNDVNADGCTVYFYDGDGDGYGDIAKSGCYCAASGHYDVTGVTSTNDDCNDASSTVNPGITTENCDTTDDDDCDGTVNEQNGDNCDAYYVDADVDGYGAGTSQCWCSATGTRSSTVSTDCNDASASIHPGATETCDYVDQDCDGSTDEGTTHYYTDSDGDGYGTTASETCTSGGGRVTASADCDDADERVYPSAPELCDEQMNDCSGGAWVSSDEDDTVSYATTADVWSDVTSAWAAGTAATPITISTASTGTYYVCPGTWYAGLSASFDDVSVIGPYGSSVTTLDLNGANSSVVSAASSDVYLEGLTLTGGIGTIGGAYRYGGGLFLNAPAAGDASATLVDCDVSGNTASYGGGINAFGYAVVTMTNTDVHSNTASIYGGGLYLQKATVTCTNGGVYSNTATTKGSGAYFTSTNQSSLTSTSCDWTNNAPDDAAGAAGGFATKLDSAYGASATFSCAGNTGCSP